LGNHDYASFLSVNSEGQYDIQEVDRKNSIIRAFSRLSQHIFLKKSCTTHALNVPHHKELIQLIKETSFELLDNRTKFIPIKESGINLTGLGEYMAGQVKPDIAFQGFHENAPGIILLHNPDGAPLLLNSPGDLILAGHTHAAQVNLPWFRSKFLLCEHPEWRYGLHAVGNKWLFVSSGLGGILPFRWRAIPEVTLVTLCRPLEETEEEELVEESALQHA